MTKIPRGTVLPPKFKYELELEFFRRLTLLERLKVFLGFNIEVKIKVLTEHKTGSFSVNQLTVVPVKHLDKEGWEREQASINPQSHAPDAV